MDSNNALNALRTFIKDHFSPGELRQLCFEIEINFDEAVEGNSFNEKVVDLVEYVKRRGRLDELITVVHGKRDLVSWPEIIDTLLAKPNIEQVETGIKALHSLARDPNVRQFISQYQNLFKDTLQSLEMIRYYKLLHDLFQEMELRYNLIAKNERPRLDGETPNWSGIITTQSVLEVSINDLLHQAKKEKFAVQTSSWLPFLQTGLTTFKTAVAKEAIPELDTSLRYLYRALDRGLPRVNSYLVDAANALPFKPLIDAMNGIQAKIGSGFSHSEVDQQILNGIQGLEKLNIQLSDLVTQHNDWQRLDDELRRVDSLINLDLTELEKTWPDIQDMARVLFYQSSEFWATELKRSSERLAKSLEGESSQAMVTGFYNAYRLQVSRQFRFIDDQLLALCESLGGIVNPLDMLLRIIIGDFVG